MKIAFIVYDEMTLLDFVGAYDPIVRLKELGYLPNFEWDICAMDSSVIEAAGIEIKTTAIKPDLGQYDMVYIPGAKNICREPSFIDWIKTAESCAQIVSVCTGSIILGLAGLLNGRLATTHPTSYLELEGFTSVEKSLRIVDQGELITARGVSASIDLGLYLCEKFAGVEAREQIQSIMDYPYYK